MPVRRPQQLPNTATTPRYLPQPKQDSNPQPKKAKKSYLHVAVFGLRMLKLIIRAHFDRNVRGYALSYATQQERPPDLVLSGRIGSRRKQQDYSAMYQHVWICDLYGFKVRPPLYAIKRGVGV